MFTITFFLKSMNAPPITMVYNTEEFFLKAKTAAFKAGPVNISDDYHQELATFSENIAGIKFENMDETRKLMIEHNLYQHVTKAMMDARVESDPRITRTRGASLMNPSNMPQFNGR